VTAPFISQQDVANVLKRTPDATPWAIAIDAACEMVRGECRQHLNYEQDDTVELQGSREDVLWLPQRPVADVSAVSIYWRGMTQVIGVGSLKWTRRGELFARWDPGIVLNGWTDWDYGTWGGAEGTLVTVTYSHGYAPTEDAVTPTVPRMPSDIRRIAISVAARILERTSEEAKDEIGYVGQNSRSVEDPQMYLKEDECKALRRYRLPSVTTSVGVMSL